ncbi:alpha/beta hydrolase [Sphingobacterium hungaricum]
MRLSFLLIFLAPIFSFAQSDSIAEQFLIDQKKYTDYEKAHGGWLSTKNTNLHYLTRGNPNGIPFLWLHGSLSNAYEILPIVNELTKNNIYVISVDYYGHGKTKFPETEVSVDNLADDISQLLNHLDIDKVTIGGFSRGAYLATAFYKNYPEKTSALILEDGGLMGLHYNLKTKSKDWLSNYISEQIENKPAELFQNYQSEQEAYQVLNAYTDKKYSFTNLSFINKNKNGEFVIYKEQESLYWMDDKKRFVEMILSPENSSLFQRTLLNLGLNQLNRPLTVPTLVLEAQSENDPLPYAEDYLKFSKNNPDLVSHLIFEETQHHIKFQHPVRFAESVIQFILQ